MYRRINIFLGRLPVRFDFRIGHKRIFTLAKSITFDSEFYTQQGIAFFLWRVDILNYTLSLSLPSDTYALSVYFQFFVFFEENINDKVVILNNSLGIDTGWYEAYHFELFWHFQVIFPYTATITTYCSYVFCIIQKSSTYCNAMH